MRAFWRQRWAGQLSGLWARCENCGWSGPYEFFDLWQATIGTLYICSSPACQTEWVRRALAASGFVRCDWERAVDPGREAYE